MWKKIDSYVFATLACLLLIGAGFALGASSHLADRGSMPIYSQAATVAPSSTPDLSLFWEAWQLVHGNYLNDSKVSDEEKVRGAVAGLVASLGDPYSEYFTPSDAQKFQEDVTGNFGGIGTELGLRDNALTVVSPLKGSPAEKAGLKPEDKILFINATSTEGIPVQQAVDYIRGPKGTSVKLTVSRQGADKPQEFNIIRQDIVAPTIDLTMKGDVAYIQLYQFNANADRLFQDAIRKAALQGTHGVVLDLRGNPGGYLEVAVDLAGWFLPRGSIVVSQQGRTGAPEVMRANGNAALARIPVVVLIDGGSASAAEILAGALRDQKHVPLVGETSFGKGTVQELETLSDGSLVKLTVAHWVLPSGKILEDGGLKPDYEVKLSEDDAKNKRDPQLDKALEVLKGQMK